MNLRDRPVAVVLALLAMLALTVLPPLLVAPRGTFELIATATLTLLACVLVASVLYDILWR